MKKFTFLLLSLLTSMMTWAQSELITEVPAGSDVRTYLRSGKCYYSKPYIESDGTEVYYSYEGEQGGAMTVVFAGNEVYLKDPIYGLEHNVYVKGLLSEDRKTITVSLPQNLYFDEKTYKVYVQMSVGRLSSGGLYIDEDVNSVSYTISEDGAAIALTGFSAEKPLGAFWSDTKDFGGVGEWDTELELYVVKEVLTGATLPEGVSATELPLAGTNQQTAESLADGLKVKVGRDADTVYVQGLVPSFPEAWAKGVLRASDGRVSFPIQFLSYDSEENPYYLAGLSADGSNMSAFTMTYDADLGSYAADGILVLNNSDLEFNADAVKGAYSGLYIGNRPQLVSIPEGTQIVKMGYEGRFDNSEREISKAGILEVGFYGEDVYIKGLFGEAPESWIKGSYTNDLQTEVSFPLGQYIGFDNQGNIFAVGEPAATFGVKSSKPENIVFSCSEEKVLVLQNGIFASRKKDAITYGSMLKKGLTINDGDLWVAADNNYTNAQDITEITLSEGVTGTLSQGENSNAPKYYDSGSSLRMYAGNTLTITSSEDRPVTKVVFVMGEDDKYKNLEANVGSYSLSGNIGTWTGEQSEIVFSVPNVSGNQARIQAVIVFYINYSTTIVQAPEGLIVNPYTLTATLVKPGLLGDWDATTETITRDVTVGFEGNYVYFQGLSEVLPEVWVRGKLDEGKVTIPAWFMGVGKFAGIVEGFYNEKDMKFGESVFDYNEEANQFSASAYTTQAFDGYWAPAETFKDVTIVKKASVAATPANPTVEEFEGDGIHNYVSFVVPQKDTEGKLLVSDDLFFNILVKQGETVKPLTFNTELYRSLAANLTEVPFAYVDNDISNSRISLLQTDEEMQTWDAIGVQSIYRGGGAEHKSDIDWKDLTEYWYELGITDVAASQSAATLFFDMQGRQATASQKGLLIKQVRLSDGSVKTMKVFRK